MQYWHHSHSSKSYFPHGHLVERCRGEPSYGSSSSHWTNSEGSCYPIHHERFHRRKIHRSSGCKGSLGQGFNGTPQEGGSSQGQRKYQISVLSTISSWYIALEFLILSSSSFVRACVTLQITALKDLFEMKARAHVWEGAFVDDDDLDGFIVPDEHIEWTSRRRHILFWHPSIIIICSMISIHSSKNTSSRCQ